MTEDLIGLTLLDRIDWLAALREAGYTADVEEWSFLYEWIQDLFENKRDIDVYDPSDRLCSHPWWCSKEVEHREVTPFVFEHRVIEECYVCKAEFVNDWVTCECNNS
jgi:hypothetical protein